MPPIPLETKRWCGMPRKVLLCTASFILIALVTVTVTVLLTRPPDDIKTEEQTESDFDTSDETLTVIKTASFSGISVSGSLSLVRETNGNSSYLALSGFALDEPCDDLEIRLLHVVGFTSGSGGGDIALPLPAGETEFTESLGADFDEDLYDQVSVRHNILSRGGVGRRRRVNSTCARMYVAAEVSNSQSRKSYLGLLQN